MNPRPALDDVQRPFSMPRELGTSRPRDVRLSAGGRALAALAACLFVAALGAGIGMSRVADRQARDERAFAQEGVDARGEVIHLWRASDENKSRWVLYRYTVDGRPYEGRSTLGSAAWNLLRVGSTLPVRYVRSAPERSLPGGVQPSVMPRWLPFVISGALAATGGLCVFLIRRQRLLLAEGRATPAVVTGHVQQRTQHGATQQSFTYSFRMLSGAAAGGKSGPTNKPPAVGSTICVLYDPDRPGRNSPYPLPLVRLARV